MSASVSDKSIARHSRPRLSRIDFAPPGASCEQCNRPLVYAFVVRQDRKESYLGHDCASKVLRSSVSSFGVPNLTRYAVDPNGQAIAPPDRSRRGAGSDDDAIKEALAIEYLLLRSVLIPSVLGKRLTNTLVVWNAFNNAVIHYRSSGSLLAPHVTQITRAMTTSKDGFPLLSYENLHGVYVAANLLRHELNRTKNPVSIAFFESLLDSLGANLYLSPRQVAQMSRDQNRRARIRVTHDVMRKAYEWAQAQREIRLAARKDESASKDTQALSESHAPSSPPVPDRRF